MPKSRSAKEQARRDMTGLRAKYGMATVEYHSPAADKKLKEKVGEGRAYRSERAKRKKRYQAEKATR